MTSAPSFLQFAAAIELPLTPAQRVYCAVAFDRTPIAELDPGDQALAHQLFGADVGEIPPLAYGTLVMLFGRASGKTSLAGAYLVWRALVADLSKLAPGELGYSVIVAPDLETGRQTLSFARSVFERSEGLSRYLESDTSDTLLIARPDGHRVAVQVFAASAGGKALRGRSIIDAVLDESAFFRDSSATINDQHIFDAIVPRLLGAILCPTTPWTQTGLVWKLFDANHGKPSTALVARAPTALMRPDDAALLARLDAARELDPVSAARELDCEWLPTGSGNLFDATALAASIVDYTDRAAHGTISIGGDLGLLNDPTAFVVIQKGLDKQGDSHDRLRVLEVVELKPRRGAPLELERIVRRAADLCIKYNVSKIRVDHHSLAQAREWASKLSLPVGFEAASEAREDRELRFQRLVDSVKRGKLLIPREHRNLVEQLGSLVATPRPGGGHAFTAPRRAGTHCDAAMACVLACEPLVEGPSFAEALARNPGRAMARARMLCGAVAGLDSFQMSALMRRPDQSGMSPSFCSTHNSNWCGCIG
jgi:hypothetical protein